MVPFKSCTCRAQACRPAGADRRVQGSEGNLSQLPAQPTAARDRWALVRANVLTNFGHEPRSMRKQRQHSAELPLQGRVAAPGTGNVPQSLAGPGLHPEDPGEQAARQQREVAPRGSRHAAFR